MLCMSRKPGQKIVIAGGIEVTVLSVKGDRVQIGVEAPREIAVHREELLNKPEEDAA